MHKKITVGTWQSGNKIIAQQFTKFTQTVAFNYSFIVHKRKGDYKKKNTVSTDSGA
jgi:hypothetical protein